MDWTEELERDLRPAMRSVTTLQEEIDRSRMHALACTALPLYNLARDQQCRGEDLSGVAPSPQRSKLKMYAFIDLIFHTMAVKTFCHRSSNDLSDQSDERLYASSLVKKAEKSGR